MIPSPPFNSITLGPVTIHLYGLILGISLGLTYYLASKWAPKKGLSPKFIDTAYLFIIPLSLVGARAYHVISNWDYYSTNLSEIPAIWNGGIGILGGIITGLLALWFLARSHKIPFLTLTDFFAPLLALGQAIGRWGNYVNQELYGQPTNLPWAIQIDPPNRLPNYTQFSTFHPLFLYESILNLFNFYILLKLLKNPLLFRISNFDFRFSATAAYLILYGLTRFSLEFLKIDPDTTNTFIGLKTAQYIGIIMVSIGTILICRHPNPQNGPSLNS